MLHTKGPWRVEQVDYSEGEDVYFEIHGGPKGDNDTLLQTWIKEVKREHVMIERDRANCTLAAAAPDLLEAAKTVLAHLNARIDRAVEEGQPVPLFDGIAALHDAISKAEGQAVSPQDEETR